MNGTGQAGQRVTKNKVVKLSPKMLKALKNTDSWGRIMADRRTQKALKSRGLVRYEIMFVGHQSSVPGGDLGGYWPTVEAFELLEELTAVSHE